MSMLGTLGKLVVGIAVAKGAGSLLGKTNGKGGLGDLLGGLTGGNNTNDTGTSTSSGGIGDLLGSLVSGATGKTQNTNHTQTSNPSAHNEGSLSDVLSNAFAGHKKDTVEDEDKKSKILLRAMISAAKADGEVDKEEQAKITKYLDDITPDEVEFITNELTAPLDVDTLIADVPSTMANEVYLISLMTIDLDNDTEIKYMQKLANGLAIDAQTANKIHSELGITPIH